MSNARRPVLGYTLYLVAALMWSINGTVSKILLDTSIPATRLSQLRVSIAWLVIFIIVMLTRRASIRINSWQEFLILALYGILGVTMTQWLYFVAIHRLPVGLALIIEFTAPLMVAMWVRFAWSHHVPRFTWVGLAIALTGLVLITEVWNGFALDLIGTLAAAGAAAALALYYLAGEKSLHADPPRDPLSLTMWGFLFASVFWAVLQPWWSFPWHFLQGTATPFGAGTTQFPLWTLASWMILFGTVLPFWIALVAMKHISAQQASAMGMTEPVIASLIAWLVLHETLTGWQLLGGVVTLSGIAIAENARR